MKNRTHLASYALASETRRHLSPHGSSRQRSRSGSQRNSISPSKSSTTASCLSVMKFSEVVKTTPSVIDGSKISVVEKRIAELDLLPDRFRFIETLFLSNNQLTSLNGIDQFPHLKVLSVANNHLSSFEAIQSLSTLTKLSFLNLEYNLICQLPNYRPHVVQLVPSLRMLDNKEISSAERKASEEALKRELNAFRSMAADFCILQKLQMGKLKIKLHEELRETMLIRRSVRLRSCFHPALFLRLLIDQVSTETEEETIKECLRREVRKTRNLMMCTAAGRNKSTSEVWEAAFEEVQQKQLKTMAALIAEIESVKIPPRESVAVATGPPPLPRKPRSKSPPPVSNQQNPPKRPSASAVTRKAEKPPRKAAVPTASRDYLAPPQPRRHPSPQPVSQAPPSSSIASSGCGGGSGSVNSSIIPVQYLTPSVVDEGDEVWELICPTTGGATDNDRVGVEEEDWRAQCQEFAPLGNAPPSAVGSQIPRLVRPVPQYSSAEPRMAQPPLEQVPNPNGGLPSYEQDEDRERLMKQLRVLQIEAEARANGERRLQQMNQELLDRLEREKVEREREEFQAKLLQQEQKKVETVPPPHQPQDPEALAINSSRPMDAEVSSRLSRMEQENAELKLQMEEFHRAMQQTQNQSSMVVEACVATCTSTAPASSIHQPPTNENANDEQYEHLLLRFELLRDLRLLKRSWAVWHQLAMTSQIERSVQHTTRQRTMAATMSSWKESAAQRQMEKQADKFYDLKMMHATLGRWVAAYNALWAENWTNAYFQNNLLRRFFDLWRRGMDRRLSQSGTSAFSPEPTEKKHRETRPQFSPVKPFRFTPTKLPFRSPPRKITPNQSIATTALSTTNHSFTATSLAFSDPTSPRRVEWVQMQRFFRAWMKFTFVSKSVSRHKESKKKLLAFHRDLLHSRLAHLFHFWKQKHAYYSKMHQVEQAVKSSIEANSKRTVWQIWTRQYTVRLREQLSAAAEAITNLQDELHQRSQRAAAVDIENLKLIDRIHGLVEEESRLKSEMQKNARNATNLTQAVEDGLIMETSMKRQMECYKTSMADTETQIRALRSELSRQQDEMVSLQALHTLTNSQQEAKLQRLNELLLQRDAELKDSRDQLQQMQRDQETLQLEHNSKLTAALQTVQMLRKALEQSQARARELESSGLHQHLRTEGVQEHLSSVTKQMVSGDHQKEQQILDLQRQLALMESQLFVANNKLDAARQTIAHKDSHICKLVQEITSTSQSGLITPGTSMKPEVSPRPSGSVSDTKTSTMFNGSPHHDTSGMPEASDRVGGAAQETAVGSSVTRAQEMNIVGESPTLADPPPLSQAATTSSVDPGKMEQLLNRLDVGSTSVLARGQGCTQSEGAPATTTKFEHPSSASQSRGMQDLNELAQRPPRCPTASMGLPNVVAGKPGGYPQFSVGPTVNSPVALDTLSTTHRQFHTLYAHSTPPISSALAGEPSASLPGNSCSRSLFAPSSFVPMTPNSMAGVTASPIVAASTRKDRPLLDDDVDVSTSILLNALSTQNRLNSTQPHPHHVHPQPSALPVPASPGSLEVSFSTTTATTTKSAANRALSTNEQIKLLEESLHAKLGM